MKKNIDIFSNLGIIIVYLVLTPIFIYIKNIQCVKMLGQTIYCLSDLLCFNEHTTKVYLYPLIMILLIKLLNDDFRINVIIRYKSLELFLLQLMLKIFKIAVLIAMYQTVIAVTLGLQYAQYMCNWDSFEGAPFFVVGALATNIPTILMVFAYFFSVFITILVLSIITIILWGITEKPIFGYMCMLVLLAVEMGIHTYVRLLFSYVDLKPETLYLSGINWKEFAVYPIVISIILVQVELIILKRKDFLRMN